MLQIAVFSGQKMQFFWFPDPKNSQDLEVETSGIGLSSSDEAMLMETCGNGTAVLRAGKIQELGENDVGFIQNDLGDHSKSMGFGTIRTQNFHTVESKGNTKTTQVGHLGPTRSAFFASANFPMSCWSAAISSVGVSPAFGRAPTALSPRIFR